MAKPKAAPVAKAAKKQQAAAVKAQTKKAAKKVSAPLIKAHTGTMGSLGNELYATQSRQRRLALLHTNILLEPYCKNHIRRRLSLRILFM